MSRTPPRYTDLDSRIAQAKRTMEKQLEKEYRERKKKEVPTRRIIRPGTKGQNGTIT